MLVTPRALLTAQPPVPNLPNSNPQFVSWSYTLGLSRIPKRVRNYPAVKNNGKEPKSLVHFCLNCVSRTFTCCESSGKWPNGAEAPCRWLCCWVFCHPTAVSTTRHRVNSLDLQDFKVCTLFSLTAHTCWESGLLAVTTSGLQTYGEKRLLESIH